MFMQNQIVSISVQFLKGEFGSIAVVDFVNGICQNTPGPHCNCSVHGHVGPKRLCQQEKDNKNNLSEDS